MANLSNINNKFIVTDGNNGRVLIGATNDIGATLFANHPSTTAPSLTFNAPAGQVFENEDLQIAFGLNNSSPYNGYMQTRFVSAPYYRNLAINPLGGNVGIGTNSPDTKLDVNGEVVISPNTDGKQTFKFTTNAADDGRFLIKSVDTVKVDIQANGDSYFNGGNVGIGVASGIDANLRIDANSATLTQEILKVKGGGSGGAYGFLVEANNGDDLFKVNTLSYESYFPNGNVGIGVASLQPWARLQVAGTAGAQTEAKQALYVTSPSTTAGEGVGIRMSAASGSNEAVGIIGMVNNASGNSGSMTFHTYNAGGDIPERMRIDNVGNVGIGTDSPGTFLQLGSYPVSGTYVNNATYPDVPSEHMIHLTAPSTTGYFGGGISFGENAFTAANITAVDAGGGGALHLAFGTGNSSGMTERMRIANNGNVGIGTDSPSVSLDIAKSGARVKLIDGTNQFNMGLWDSVNYRFEGDANRPMLFTSYQGNIKLGISGGTTMLIQSSNVGIGMTSGVLPGKLNVSANSGTTTPGVGDGIFVGPYQGNSIVGSNWSYSNAGYTYTDFCSRYDSSSSFMRFIMKASATPVYAMTIRGDGRVGIGPTSPDFALDISAVDSGVQLQIGRTNTNVGSTWMGSDSNGFHLGVGAYGSGNSVSDPNGFTVKSNGQIDFASPGTPNQSGISMFGGTSGGIMYMYRPVGQNGDIIRFQTAISSTASTRVGYINTTSSATTYNSASDYRLKENVTKITNALDRVSKLKPSRFNFIIEPKNTVDGFIAHEVQKIVPEAVTGVKDDIDENGNNHYQGMDNARLVPLLTAAIQELEARVKELENK